MHPRTLFSVHRKMLVLGGWHGLLLAGKRIAHQREKEKDESMVFLIQEETVRKIERRRARGLPKTIINSSSNIARARDLPLVDRELGLIGHSTNRSCTLFYRKKLLRHPNHMSFLAGAYESLRGPRRISCRNTGLWTNGFFLLYAAGCSRISM